MHLWTTVACQICSCSSDCCWSCYQIADSCLFVVGLAFTGTGLLSEMFPVSGIDLVHESLHGFEGGGFPLLSHNVLDSFRKTGIIAVSENSIVPISADGKSVELDVIFD